MQSLTMRVSVACAAAPRPQAGRAAAAAAPAAATLPARPRAQRRAEGLRRVAAQAGEAAPAEQLQSFATTEPQRVRGGDGQLAPMPGTPGVYAVYDSTGDLQYVGISRKVAVSMATHAEALPEQLVFAAKVLELPDAGKDELQAAWKQWMQEAVAETGAIPPGNAPGQTLWQQRRARASKPEIKLTPGKGVQDLTCSLEDLIDQVVKNCKVVAFVKGTRTQPQCGFSHQVLTILTESGADFEVVNVLDEIYNPGLREAIKTYSAWPTIPQIYIGGEFVGGADIFVQMHGSGELKQALTAAGAVKA
ncbi:Monothiol glutaredoxin-chloroplastic [Micractinium conductrix]|uniref:Monothiol glutaredoxin-chloroplastic n=1 Tax=Micractinium conductrix TaxID=554055 RepID=A0A2P6VRJ3_9CHLO|nr:Monothiol glutaredoxin-chloroplastic [Micractinium conductrix]|eukprot:PSC76690.1 Monothiol glutaredoxin-chloroplastic [Micractinium conductrix]